MTGTRTKVMRLVVAALLVLPAIVASVSPSLAAPSQQDVQDAKAKLAQLQEQFAALDEQWNEARYQLAGPGASRRGQGVKESAEADAAEARGRLAERAVQAYTGMGSQYEALLSANSMTSSPIASSSWEPSPRQTQICRQATNAARAPNGRLRGTTTPRRAPAAGRCDQGSTGSGSDSM